MYSALFFRPLALSLWRSAAGAVFASTLGAALFSAPLVAQGGPDALATATSAIRAGRFDEAIYLIRQALLAHPEDPRLHTAEGVAYSLKQDDAHALACFQAALKASPGFRRALQAEAAILSRRHDPAAIPVLQQILQEDPHDTTAHEMLAVAEAQKNDCTAALDEFRVAGESLAGHAESLQREAACLLETRAYPEAVTAFQQVQKLRPDDTGTRYDLAVAQLEAGDAKAASSTLSPLLEHEPDVDTLLLASEIAEQTGDTPRAAVLLRQAILADPTRSNSYVRFAELCMAHESYQPGVDMVTAGLARQLHDPTLFLARGLLYGGMAEYGKAEDDFRNAELYDPQHGTGAYGVGLIEAQRNNPGQALATVRTALGTHPEDAQLHFLLARLLLEEGAQPDSPSYMEATHSAQEAVRLNPGLAAARDLLGKIYLETGKPALAVEQCRAALALDPGDGKALYRLMRSLRATGDNAGAQAVSRQVTAQLQQAREQETARLRYRIEEGAASETKPLEVPARP